MSMNLMRTGYEERLPSRQGDRASYACMCCLARHVQSAHREVGTRTILSLRKVLCLAQAHDRAENPPEPD